MTSLINLFFLPFWPNQYYCNQKAVYQKPFRITALLLFAIILLSKLTAKLLFVDLLGFSVSSRVLLLFHL